MTVQLTSTEAQAVFDAMREARDRARSDASMLNVPAAFVDDAKRRTQIFDRIIGKLMIADQKTA